MLVPGYKRIEGNETVDQLARRGSLYPFTGPQPICGYLWESSSTSWTGFIRSTGNSGSRLQDKKHAKGFLDRPSAKMTTEFLKLSLFQTSDRTIKWTLPPKQPHLQTWEVNNCRRCYQEREAASYIFSDCDSFTQLQFHNVGRDILKPCNCHEIPLCRTLLCSRHGTTGKLEDEDVQKIG
jgi:hypothetical protein